MQVIVYAAVLVAMYLLMRLARMLEKPGGATA
jgi:hypothetical protein